jgi:hypothetical protein
MLPMTLAEFMQLKKLDDERFAALLRGAGHPVDRATVYRWRNGIHAPRQKSLRAIMVVTRGKVTANDFVSGLEDEGAE